MSWSNQFSVEVYKTQLLQEKMEGINIEVMKRYIESRGFKLVEYPNKDFICYEGHIEGSDDPKGFAFILPSTDRFRETFAAIVHRMEFFAFLDKVSFEEMIQKVKQFS